MRSVNATPTAARSRRASSTARALAAGGLLLQDFPLAEVGPSRRDPRHGRPRPPRSEQSAAADTPQFNARCDLLVVGAGPRGSRGGRRGGRGGAVFLVDDHAEIGGQLVHRGGAIEGGDWRDWALRVRARSKCQAARPDSNDCLRRLRRQSRLRVSERRRPSPTRSGASDRKRIVIAAGAIERPLVVPDNDEPGVMSADAALVYLKRFGVFVGERIVGRDQQRQRLCRCGRLGRGGAGGQDHRSARAARPARRTHARRGRESVIGARSRRNRSRRRADARVRRAAAHRRMVADRASLRPGARTSATTRGARPSCPCGGVENLTVVGAANGAFTLAEGLREGHAAGGGEGPAQRARGSLHRRSHLAEGDDEGRRWIDFQSDVTLKDVALAAREGYVSVEHAQALHHARHGDRSGQDRQCRRHRRARRADRAHDRRDRHHHLSPAFRAGPDGRHRGVAIEQLINPLRRLPLEASTGPTARDREYGGWLRPACYGAGRSEQTIPRETARHATPSRSSTCSPLGKIEMTGPDAAALPTSSVTTASRR